jgi:hypothetical protein
MQGLFPENSESALSSTTNLHFHQRLVQSIDESLGGSKSVQSSVKMLKRRPRVRSDLEFSKHLEKMSLNSQKGENTQGSPKSNHSSEQAESDSSFHHNKADCDIDSSINEEARKSILMELRRLLEFLQLRNERDIKGASLLLILDHFSRSYAVKMIDLSSLRIYSERQQRDEGLIFGVKNLISFIENLE